MAAQIHCCIHWLMDWHIPDMNWSSGWTRWAFANSLINMHFGCMQLVSSFDVSQVLLSETWIVDFDTDQGYLLMWTRFVNYISLSHCTQIESVWLRIAARPLPATCIHFFCFDCANVCLTCFHLFGLISHFELKFDHDQLAKQEHRRKHRELILPLWVVTGQLTWGFSCLICGFIEDWFL